MAPSLHSRDIDLSGEAVRKAFTPRPQEQRVTLYVLASFIAAVFVIMTLPRIWWARPIAYLPFLLWPWILLCTWVHEAAHAAGVLITGAVPLSIAIHLGGGGVTIFPARGNGLRDLALVSPSGYLFAGLFGASFVFAGFSIFAVGCTCYPVLNVC